MELGFEQSRLFIQACNAGPQTPTYSGSIVDVAEDRLTILFEDTVSLKPNELITIGYYDPGTNRYLGANAKIIAASTDGIRPLLEITLTSAFVETDRRNSFRISAIVAKINFVINGSSVCGVIDVSAHGLAVSTSGEFNVDDLVSIVGEFEDTHCSGEARVCSIAPLKRGRKRIGLDFSIQEQDCRDWLGELTNSLQRRQLQRRGGTSVKKFSKPKLANSTQKISRQFEDSETLIPAALQYLTVQIPIDLLLKRPLPGTLYDDEKSVLARVGQQLTPNQVLVLVEAPIILGQDWWIRNRKTAPATTPQHKPVAPSSYDKLRAFQRTEWEVTAFVQLLEEHDTRKFEAKTCDISQGGLSFLSKSYIYVGTRLAVKVNDGDLVYETQGRVASCEYDSNTSKGFHRIGVQFTKADIEPESSKSKKKKAG